MTERDLKAIAKQKPIPILYIWLGLFALACLISGFELVATGSFIGKAAFLSRKVLGGPVVHIDLSIVKGLLTNPLFWILNAFAVINPLVLTIKADNSRRIFALGFALSSLGWLLLGAMLLPGDFHLTPPFPELRHYAGSWAAPSLFIAGLVQLILSIKVAKESVQRWKNIEDMSAAEKKTFEIAIFDLKTAKSRNECSILAGHCLQLLTVKGKHLGEDDLQTLTKELVRQKRGPDAEAIAQRYVELVESTLLPPS